MTRSLTCLNLGAGPHWHKAGWETLDHKSGFWDTTTAWDTGLPAGRYDWIFTSHMLEHIPHYRVDQLLKEMNRLLKPGGRVRILTPDLETIARMYVNRDEQLLARLRGEDETIRHDLGWGGAFVNYVVSPGNDSLLISRNGELIAGYGHVYLFDFAMLETLLRKHGFTGVKRCGFLESSLADFAEPLHPDTEPAVWKDEQTWRRPFTSTSGFDRDPVTSLIVEAEKAADSTAPIYRFGGDNVPELKPVSEPTYRAMRPESFTWICFLRPLLQFARARAIRRWRIWIDRVNTGYWRVRSGVGRMIRRRGGPREV